jgi:hypothetical protein
MAAGAATLLAVILVVMHFQGDAGMAGQLALKVRRLDLVDRIGLSLASAAEAERSAVMATTDADSQAYADQARAAAAAAEQACGDLEGLLTPAERTLLMQFTEPFAEFKRIEDQVIDLAVRNTNLKASSLAFGEAFAAVRQMDAGLSRLPSDDVKIVRLADDARIGAWRLLALLPPHIAEESDEKMDALEAEMAKQDQQVRFCLDALAALPGLSGNEDLMAATARYARLGELRTQIVKLSRENTNVRSLSVSLTEGRRVMLTCQAALASLRQAVEHEPIAGRALKEPASPRGL